MSSLRLVGISLLASLALFPLQAAAWDRGEVETFATLPAGNANPEGIAADKHGNIYVTTFAPTAPAGPTMTRRPPWLWMARAIVT